jgi:hypothetical protein
MRLLLKYFVVAMATVIAMVSLSSCGRSDAKVVVPGTGNISGTFYQFVPGTTQAQCSVPAIAWTASGPSGLSQTIMTAATTGGMSQCKTYDPIEGPGPGVTKCHCSVPMNFTSLLPVTWTIRGTFANPDGTTTTLPECKVKVNANQTATYSQYSDLGCLTPSSPGP